MSEYREVKLETVKIECDIKVELEELIVGDIPDVGKDSVIENNDELFCLLCQTDGHITEKCPELRCRVCQEKGHPANKCTRNINIKSKPQCMIQEPTSSNSGSDNRLLTGKVRWFTGSGTSGVVNCEEAGQKQVVFIRRQDVDTEINTGDLINFRLKTDERFGVAAVDVRRSDGGVVNHDNIKQELVNDDDNIKKEMDDTMDETLEEKDKDDPELVDFVGDISVSGNIESIELECESNKNNIADKLDKDDQMLEDVQSLAKHSVTIFTDDKLNEDDQRLVAVHNLTEHSVATPIKEAPTKPPICTCKSRPQYQCQLCPYMHLQIVEVVNLVPGEATTVLTRLIGRGDTIYRQVRQIQIEEDFFSDTANFSLLRQLGSHGNLKPFTRPVISTDYTFITIISHQIGKVKVEPGQVVGIAQGVRGDMEVVVDPLDYTTNIYSEKDLNIGPGKTVYIKASLGNPQPMDRHMFVQFKNRSKDSVKLVVDSGRRNLQVYCDRSWTWVRLRNTGQRSINVNKFEVVGKVVNSMTTIYCNRVIDKMRLSTDKWKRESSLTSECSMTRSIDGGENSTIRDNSRESGSSYNPFDYRDDSNKFNKNLDIGLEVPDENKPKLVDNADCESFNKSETCAINVNDLGNKKPLEVKQNIFEKLNEVIKLFDERTEVKRLEQEKDVGKKRKYLLKNDEGEELFLKEERVRKFIDKLAEDKKKTEENKDNVQVLNKNAEESARIILLKEKEIRGKREKETEFQQPRINQNNGEKLKLTNRSHAVSPGNKYIAINDVNKGELNENNVDHKNKIKNEIIVDEDEIVIVEQICKKSGLDKSNMYKIPESNLLKGSDTELSNKEERVRQIIQKLIKNKKEIENTNANEKSDNNMNYSYDPNSLSKDNENSSYLANTITLKKSTTVESIEENIKLPKNIESPSSSPDQKDISSSGNLKKARNENQLEHKKRETKINSSLRRKILRANESNLLTKNSDELSSKKEKRVRKLIEKLAKTKIMKANNFNPKGINKIRKEGNGLLSLSKGILKKKTNNRRDEMDKNLQLPENQKEVAINTNLSEELNDNTIDCKAEDGVEKTVDDLKVKETLREKLIEDEIITTPFKSKENVIQSDESIHRGHKSRKPYSISQIRRSNSSGRKGRSPERWRPSEERYSKNSKSHRKTSRSPKRNYISSRRNRNSSKKGKYRSSVKNSISSIRNRSCLRKGSSRSPTGNSKSYRRKRSYSRKRTSRSPIRNISGSCRNGSCSDKDIIRNTDQERGKLLKRDTRNDHHNCRDQLGERQNSSNKLDKFTENLLPDDQCWQCCSSKATYSGIFKIISSENITLTDPALVLACVQIPVIYRPITQVTLVNSHRTDIIITNHNMEIFDGNNCLVWIRPVNGQSVAIKAGDKLCDSVTHTTTLPLMVMSNISITASSSTCVRLAVKEDNIRLRDYIDIWTVRNSITPVKLDCQRLQVHIDFITGFKYIDIRAENCMPHVIHLKTGDIIGHGMEAVDLNCHKSDKKSVVITERTSSEVTLKTDLVESLTLGPGETNTSVLSKVTFPLSTLIVRPIINNSMLRTTMDSLYGSCQEQSLYTITDSSRKEYFFRSILTNGDGQVINLEKGYNAVNIVMDTDDLLSVADDLDIFPDYSLATNTVYQAINSHRTVLPPGHTMEVQFSVTTCLQNMTGNYDLEDMEILVMMNNKDRPGLEILTQKTKFRAGQFTVNVTNRTQLYKMFTEKENNLGLQLGVLVIVKTLSSFPPVENTVLDLFSDTMT